MRASLLLVPLLFSCGGGSTTSGGSTAEPNGKEVAGPGTKGFDEYPQEYGADEYGEFGYYDGYDEGYWGGEGYGGYGYGYDEPYEPYTPPPPMPPDITGTWNGVCEAGAKDSKKLGFAISASRWDLTYETFADTTCGKRTSTIQIGGTYVFGDQSPTVTNAWNAVFSFDKRDLTADDAKTAKALGKTCGVKKLKAGQTTSLLEKGCAKLGFKPLKDCASDFDIVTVEGISLKLGTRPADNDLCTEAKRPTSVITTGFTYQWPATGIPECDQYFTDLNTWLACPQIQASIGNVDILSSFRQSAPYMNTADICKATSDAMKQYTAQMGC